MSQAYKVRWALSAETDLREIILYIANHSADNARTTLAKIKTQAASLTKFPNKGRIVPELAEHGVSLYHELIIERWRLIYRVAETEVLVLVVIDSKRNVEDILLRRLLR